MGHWILILCFFPALAYGAQEYIVGGEIVSPVGKWPYQCALYQSGSFNCGCVLLDDQRVLTAGHCATSTA